MTRALLFLVVAALLFVPGPARAGDLTLRDVIELHRSGLGDELLIAVIEADGGPFTLDFTDIHDLKREGLGERVITALVRTGSRPDKRGAESPAVSVEQHVTNVVPGLVVVGSPRALAPDDHSGHRQRDGHAGDGRDGRRRSRDNDVPAATWITRREDGRNIDQEQQRRPHRGDKPAATWVTPNSRTETRREGEKPPRD